jgi:hypothetical protein
MGREMAVDPVDLEVRGDARDRACRRARHSLSPKDIMCPYIDVRERKVELTPDDVLGVQLLYGSDPDFRHVTSELRALAEA